MEQEKQPLKVYYSIGEVADMFGVNTSLIRFWEKECLKNNFKKYRAASQFF